MARIFRIDEGSETISSIERIAVENKIKTAFVAAIGGLKEATIAYFNHSTKKYEEHKFKEFMEVTSLTGNITQKEGKPFVHVHVNLGRNDMSVIGGHLISATVYPFLELVVIETENSAERYFDEKYGLNAIKTK